MQIRNNNKKMYIQLKYVACILFNKTCIQEVVSKHCKCYSSYCYCNVRSFFVMFFSKDSIFEEPRTITECNQNAQKTVLLYVNSFWCPSEILSMKSWLYFFSAYHFTPRSADVILVQAKATKSFAISLTYMLDQFH